MISVYTSPFFSPYQINSWPQIHIPEAAVENSHVTICPQCGAKINSASRVFVAPELLQEVEWVCKNCGFKKKKVVPTEDTRIGESLGTKKNP